ncbi:MAG: hypothetical protein H7A24_12865 [Leptospiraceae bacterium]|nr:hypothetical protein [Leptospiraceae bacterium]MCP5512768.1 hypothetical protein [Leptospiraceae bacterium]
MFFLNSKIKLNIFPGEKRISFLLILTFVFSIEVHSKDNLYYYEEALKTENISSIMAIPLYEEFLKYNPDKNFFKSTLSRLFELYYKHKRFEDLILLDANYKLDKNKKKKALTLYKQISKNIKIKEELFLEILSLSRKIDPISRERLYDLYLQDKNKYILNFIFALKLKVQDYDTLNYFIDELNDINPVLKLFLLVKTNSIEAEKNLEDVSKISDLNSDQKMEILFLQGIYHQQNKRFKESARYFLMSDSFYSENEKRSSRSILEASKSLYLAGKDKEACSLIAKRSFLILNESDQFMILFCDPKKKSVLNSLNSSFKLLSEKEGGMVFQRYLRK